MAQQRSGKNWREKWFPVAGAFRVIPDDLDDFFGTIADALDRQGFALHRHELGDDLLRVQAVYGTPGKGGVGVELRVSRNTAAKGDWFVRVLATSLRKLRGDREWFAITHDLQEALRSRMRTSGRYKSVVKTLLADKAIEKREA